MTHLRISRRARGALTIALAVGVLLPTLTAAAPPAETARQARAPAPTAHLTHPATHPSHTARPARPAPSAPASPPAPAARAASAPVVCTSAVRGLGPRLSRDITAALNGHESTTALSVQDHRTRTRCALRDTWRFDSASVVKVTTLATLLWDAQRTRRPLTRHEADLATAMITKSDNASTDKLWAGLGPAKVGAFLKAAHMPMTVPGPNGAWGLTRITARDEQRLLNLVTHRNPVLSDASRGFIGDRMRHVIASQRWGVPAGAPSDSTVRHKNGWLERSTHGWRVHSIGTFTGNGHDYAMSVLTGDNRTMHDGVSTVEAVAGAVHRDLARA